MQYQPSLPGIESEQLLTKQSLAAKLGVTQRTVDRWLQLSVLPGELRVRIGRTTR